MTSAMPAGANGAPSNSGRASGGKSSGTVNCAPRRQSVQGCSLRSRSTGNGGVCAALFLAPRGTNQIQARDEES